MVFGGGGTFESRKLLSARSASDVRAAFTNSSKVGSLSGRLNPPAATAAEFPRCVVGVMSGLSVRGAAFQIRRGTGSRNGAIRKPGS